MAIYRGEKAVLNSGLPEPLVKSCDNGKTLIAVRGQNRPKPPFLPAIRTDIAISPKPVTIKTKVGNLWPRGLISVDPRLQKVVDDKESNKKKTLDINYKDFKYQISNEALIYINANLEKIFGNKEEKEIQSAADLTEIQISKIQNKIKTQSNDPIIKELIDLLTKPDVQDETKIGNREVIPHTESLYDIISQIGEGKLYKLIGFDKENETIQIQLNKEYSESFGDNPPTIQVNLAKSIKSKSIRERSRVDSAYPLSASNPQETKETKETKETEETEETEETKKSVDMFKNLLKFLKPTDLDALEIVDIEDDELNNENEESLDELIVYFNKNQSDSLDYQVNLEYSFNGEEFRQSYVFAEKNKPVSGDWDLLLTAYPNDISVDEKQPLNTINSKENQILLYDRTKKLFNKYKKKEYESHPLFDIEINLASLKSKNEKDNNQALNTLIEMLEKLVVDRNEKENIDSNIIKIKELNFETITALNPYFLQNIGLTNAYSALNSMLLNLAYLAKDDTLELTSMIDPIQHGEDSLNPGHRSDFDEIYISTKNENGNPVQLYAENESDLRDILVNELNHNRQTIDLHHECPLSIWAPYYDKKISTHGDGFTQYHPDPYFNEQIFINVSKFLYGSDESNSMSKIIEQAQHMHEEHKSNIVNMSSDLKNIPNSSEEFEKFMKKVVQVDNISDGFEKIDVLSDLISKQEDRIKEYCSDKFGINIHPMHPYDRNLDKFIKRHSNHSVDKKSFNKLDQLQLQLKILKEQEKYDRNLTSNNLILKDDKVIYDATKILNLIKINNGLKKVDFIKINKHRINTMNDSIKSIKSKSRKLKTSLVLNKFFNIFGLRKSKTRKLQNEILKLKESSNMCKESINKLKKQNDKLDQINHNSPYADFIQNAIRSNPSTYIGLDKEITNKISQDNISIIKECSNQDIIPTTPVEMIGNPLSRALQDEKLVVIQIEIEKSKPTTSPIDRKNSHLEPNSVEPVRKRSRASTINVSHSRKSSTTSSDESRPVTRPKPEKTISEIPGLMTKKY